MCYCALAKDKVPGPNGMPPAWCMNGRFNYASMSHCLNAEFTQGLAMVQCNKQDQRYFQNKKPYITKCYLLHIKLSLKSTNLYFYGLSKSILTREPTPWTLLPPWPTLVQFPHICHPTQAILTQCIARPGTQLVTSSFSFEELHQRTICIFLGSKHPALAFPQKCCMLLTEARRITLFV